MQPWTFDENVCSSLELAPLADGEDLHLFKVPNGVLISIPYSKPWMLITCVHIECMHVPASHKNRDIFPVRDVFSIFSNLTLPHSCRKKNTSSYILNTSSVEMSHGSLNLPLSSIALNLMACNVFSLVRPILSISPQKPPKQTEIVASVWFSLMWLYARTLFLYPWFKVKASGAQRFVTRYAYRVEMCGSLAGTLPHSSPP